MHNWWTGNNVKLFWDAGHQASFDKQGREQLAKSLAQRTFKLLKLHRVLEDSKYLGKRCGSEGSEIDSRETALPDSEITTPLKLDTKTNQNKKIKKALLQMMNPGGDSATGNQEHRL